MFLGYNLCFAMRFTYVIAAWIVFCGFQQQPSQSREADNKTANATQTNPAAKHKPSRPSTAIPSGDTDAQTDRVKSNGDENIQIVTPTPEKPVDLVERTISIIGIICTAALVIVGIRGIYIALGTLREMRGQREEMGKQVQAALLQVQTMQSQITAMSEQTAVAKENADAALLNARAVIGADRPWIVVKIERIEAELREDAAKPFWKFTMFNCGKSPGHILTCMPWIGFTEPSHLRVPPVYKHSPWNKRLLVKDEEWPIIEPFQTSQFRIPIQVEVAAREVIEGFRGNRGELVVYGLIQYTDAIARDTYKTAFCYKHVPGPLSSMGGFFVTCGPAIYNQYS